MKKKPQDVRKRTKDFALAILKLAATLPAGGELGLLKRQLARAATSVGANYRAARRAKARLSSYIRATREGPVVLTRNGSPVAVLVPVQDPDDLERLILSYSPRFQALLESARRQFDRSEGLDHEDFWAEDSPQS